MLSDGQRLRLEEEKNHLEELYKLQSEKIARLRKALVIETDPLNQFKYEQQIQEEENKLKKLTNKLDEIEKQLQSAIIEIQNKSKTLPKNRVDFKEIETPDYSYFQGKVPLPSTSKFEYEVVIYDINGQKISRDTKQAQYFSQSFSNDANLEMVYIPGGKHLMGSEEGERYNNELPQNEVIIQPFFMSKFQVTQVLWRAIASLPKINCDLDPEPSRFKGNMHPVERVSWYDTIEFCDRLSRKTKLNYCLPSEAEWEYACCAGTNTPFNFGRGNISELANCKIEATSSFNSKGDYRQETTPVGNFLPNAFGLYDMHGNVWEWCADHWHSNYQETQIDQSAWISNNKNQYQTIRGGSWYDVPSSCRCTNRDYFDMEYGNSIIGFRVVLQNLIISCKKRNNLGLYIKG